MKNHGLNLRFQDGTILNFSFSLNDENLESIASEISRNVEKRKRLVSGKFGNYIRKRDVVSHRKLFIDFLIEGKEVRTVLYNVPVSNKLLESFEDFKGVLEEIFVDYVDDSQNLIKIGERAVLN